MLFRSPSRRRSAAPSRNVLSRARLNIRRLTHIMILMIVFGLAQGSLETWWAFAAQSGMTAQAYVTAALVVHLCRAFWALTMWALFWPGHTNVRPDPAATVNPLIDITPVAAK